MLCPLQKQKFIPPLFYLSSYSRIPKWILITFTVFPHTQIHSSLPTYSTSFESSCFILFLHFH